MGCIDNCFVHAHVSFIFEWLIYESESMKVLVRGLEYNIKEFTSKFKSKFEFDTDLIFDQNIDLSHYQVIFDFLEEGPLKHRGGYSSVSDVSLFINSVKSTLTELSYCLDHSLNNTLIGFNGIPTFFNRDIIELTSINESGHSRIEEISKTLGFEYTIVEDRVGMVTPRVICMIINEAYYTVEEGTADRAAIDNAMKLGTNYPYGPFEWTQRIGIANVYEILEAVCKDTGDERYEICPLLKQEYILQK